ncbi:ATP-binding protein [Actinomycetospora sp. CA-084318]|uniref:ATP-binding protein n=1 Tax=Actinomycetospora sp. CA-084318 TaxID=3239892 RepID=UPI003D967091
MTRVLDYLPHGDLVDDEQWGRRHRFLLVVLAALCPGLAIFGLATGSGRGLTVLIALVPAVTALAGWVLRSHRTAGSLLVTAGLSASCAGLVILSGGYIEAHFSFFVIIGFLALYQNWVPFVFNILFTVASHGLGSALVPGLMFNHHMGQMSPWTWSLVHGVAVLLACIGVSIFCRITEDEQRKRAAIAEELAAAEVRQQEFTSGMLLNLARRNQSMFHRQLDIINDLEERERDPDVLAELFRLDHLATRVRRNAESLLVLSGEQPARVWSAPVALRDVVRAGIAETEDLDRVAFTVDERPRVVGSAVADLTHMIAELTENAVRFSPPGTRVSIQSRVHHGNPGAHLVIIEDTGVGMPPDELAAANDLLARPQEVDVSASRRLGFHVVSRLAGRHGIEVSLTPTPGCGVTAVVVLPAVLFAETVATPPAVPATVPTALAGAGAVNSGSFHALLPDPPEGAVPAPREGRAPVGTGRHAWPGNGNGDVPASGSRPRTALIHPVVVPPPDEAPRPEPPADGSVPGTGDTAEPSEPSEPSSPVLKRRIPQTHLAPELARPHPTLSSMPPTPAIPAGAVVSPGTDGPPAGPVGAVNALSRYQASRNAAHDALAARGAGAGPDDDTPGDGRPT